MIEISQAIGRLYNLHVGTTSAADGSPHERPHKPLLLLAVFDLIEEGLAVPDRIPWCQELRDRFTARFQIVRKHNDRDTPENPFRRLTTDGLWEVWVEEMGGSRPLDAEPKVGQFGRVFARLTEGFDVLVANPQCRSKMREALIARYFPGCGLALFGSEPEMPRAMEEEPGYGRSPAFRKKILEVYDHQCAACGLRIRLPQARDVSFIDAAHLIPFSESHNDHPTNGLALCKNHHWAMDRDILAPGTDMRWHVSKVLDPRRASGEEELLGLEGRDILLPHNPAFFPGEEGLEWRMGRLIA